MVLQLQQIVHDNHDQGQHMKITLVVFFSFKRICHNICCLIFFQVLLVLTGFHGATTPPINASISKIIHSCSKLQHILMIRYD